MHLCGVGGKPNPGEAIEKAAIRESEEEIGVTPINPLGVGVINFYFPHKPEWSQQVWVFKTTEWKGTPAETEEMKPKWFKQSEVPYEEMWWDDKIWMPKVFLGSKIRAGFMFDTNEKVVDHYLDEVEEIK
jgi:8-oxo-dGTP pyrophosphatase MutT (NUDIX family)